MTHALDAPIENIHTNCVKMSQQKETTQIKQDHDNNIPQDLKSQSPSQDDIIKQEVMSYSECATVSESCANMSQFEEKVEVKEEPIDQQLEESDRLDKKEKEQPGSDGDQKDICPCYSCTSSSPQQDILDSHVKLEHSSTDVGFNKDDLQGVLTGEKRCRTCTTESTPRKRSPETGREDNIKLKPAESVSFKICLEQLGDQCVNSNQTLDTGNCGKSSAIECSIGNKNIYNNFRNVHIDNCSVIQSEESLDKSEKCAICSKHHGLHSQNKVHTGDKPYKCDVCGSGFISCSSLTVHKRIHTGEKPYRCDVCSAQFTQNSNLKTHKRKHAGQRPYKCDVCAACFKFSSNLVTHKRTHTGEKPYKCDFCGSSFAASDKLVRHKRIHTGEKPYKCDICCAQFTQNYNLKTHKRKHTGQNKRTHTGEKPYKCDVCGSSFASSNNLIKHKRIHTGEKPYKCDICSAQFTQNSNLKNHKRTHTGEKPYKCDVCGADFAASNNLIKHKRIHTGEKPYKCDICSAQFTQNYNLKTHTRKHT